MELLGRRWTLPDVVAVGSKNRAAAVPREETNLAAAAKGSCGLA